MSLVGGAIERERACTAHEPRNAAADELASCRASAQGLRIDVEQYTARSAAPVAALGVCSAVRLHLQGTRHSQPAGRHLRLGYKCCLQCYGMPESGRDPLLAEARSDAELCHGPLQEMHGRQDIAYHKAVPCVYSALRVPMRSNARDHVTMKMATACLVAMATLDACEPRNIVSAASSMDHSLQCTQCANAGLFWVADLGSDAFAKHEIVTPVSSISLPP